MDLQDTSMPIQSGDEARDTAREDMEVSSPADPKSRKKRNDDFLTRINACKIYRRKLIQNWTINIDYRRGKPFASQTDEDRVIVPLDWAITKDKHAALFSQIPQVHIDHAPQTVQGPDLYTFEQKLNDTLQASGIEAAMDECMVDCINAAGIGAILVSHEALTVNKQVPTVDPSTLVNGKMPDGSDPQMETVPQVTDHRYRLTRISPADLLWPINFTGSNFDDAPWMGRSGRVTWAEACQKFGLGEADRGSILGEERSTLDRLTHDIDKDKTQADEMVGFDEIFFKEHAYDSQCENFSLIHHLVFVTGKDEPVIDQPWKGQQFDSQNGFVVGAQRSPLRVLTLDYISDETIPPSNSAIARPQINEINKSRTQMILQRERSLPVRWFDVNRIDPTIAQNLMRGTWQNMIPIQGQGTNAIGEVARAHHPQENFTFDQIANADLERLVGVGANQMGTGQGIETKGEADVVQQDFATRIGRERAKVSKFFVSIAEVLGGLICLFEDPSTLGENFDPQISRNLTFSILADSTVLIDSNQRLQRLIQFINFGAKSGWVDIEPVMKEIAQLSGLDPNVVIKPPQPKPPAEPNISIRLTGTADLMQPMALALLKKSGQAPSPQEIAEAQQLIIAANTLPPNAAIPRDPPGFQSEGPHKVGPSEMMPPGQAQTLQPAPGVPNAANHGDIAANIQPSMPPVPAPGQANPKWNAMPTVDKRGDEGPSEG